MVDGMLETYECNCELVMYKSSQIGWYWDTEANNVWQVYKCSVCGLIGAKHAGSWLHLGAWEKESDVFGRPNYLPLDAYASTLAAVQAQDNLHYSWSPDDEGDFLTCGHTGPVGPFNDSGMCDACYLNEHGEPYPDAIIDDMLSRDPFDGYVPDDDLFFGDPFEDTPVVRKADMILRTYPKNQDSGPEIIRLEFDSRPGV